MTKVKKGSTKICGEPGSRVRLRSCSPPSKPEKSADGVSVKPARKSVSPAPGGNKKGELPQTGANKGAKDIPGGKGKAFANVYRPKAATISSSGGDSSDDKTLSDVKRGLGLGESVKAPKRKIYRRRVSSDKIDQSSCEEKEDVAQNYLKQNSGAQSKLPSGSSTPPATAAVSKRENPRKLIRRSPRKVTPEKLAKEDLPSEVAGAQSKLPSGGSTPPATAAVSKSENLRKLIRRSPRKVTPEKLAKEDLPSEVAEKRLRLEHAHVDETLCSVTHVVPKQPPVVVEFPTECSDPDLKASRPEAFSILEKLTNEIKPQQITESPNGSQGATLDIDLKCGKETHLQEQQGPDGDKKDLKKTRTCRRRRELKLDPLIAGVPKKLLTVAEAHIDEAIEYVIKALQKSSIEDTVSAFVEEDGSPLEAHDVDMNQSDGSNQDLELENSSLILDQKQELRNPCKSLKRGSATKTLRIKKTNYKGKNCHTVSTKMKRATVKQTKTQTKKNAAVIKKTPAVTKGSKKPRKKKIPISKNPAEAKAQSAPLETTSLDLTDEACNQQDCVFNESCSPQQNQTASVGSQNKGREGLKKTSTKKNVSGGKKNAKAKNIQTVSGNCKKSSVKQMETQGKNKIKQRSRQSLNKRSKNKATEQVSVKEESAIGVLLGSIGADPTVASEMKLTDDGSCDQQDSAVHKSNLPELSQKGQSGFSSKKTRSGGKNSTMMGNPCKGLKRTISKTALSSKKINVKERNVKRTCKNTKTATGKQTLTHVIGLKAFSIVSNSMKRREIPGKKGTGLQVAKKSLKKAAVKRTGTQQKVKLEPEGLEKATVKWTETQGDDVLTGPKCCKEAAGKKTPGKKLKEMKKTANKRICNKPKASVKETCPAGTPKTPTKTPGKSVSNGNGLEVVDKGLKKTAVKPTGSQQKVKLEREGLEKATETQGEDVLTGPKCCKKAAVKKSPGKKLQGMKKTANKSIYNKPEASVNKICRTRTPRTVKKATVEQMKLFEETVQFVIGSGLGSMSEEVACNGLQDNVPCDLVADGISSNQREAASLDLAGDLCVAVAPEATQACASDKHRRPPGGMAKTSDENIKTAALKKTPSQCKKSGQRGKKTTLKKQLQNALKTTAATAKRQRKTPKQLTDVESACMDDVIESVINGHGGDSVAESDDYCKASSSREDAALSVGASQSEGTVHPVCPKVVGKISKSRSRTGPSQVNKSGNRKTKSGRNNMGKVPVKKQSNGPIYQGRRKKVTLPPKCNSPTTSSEVTTKAVDFDTPYVYINRADQDQESPPTLTTQSQNSPPTQTAQSQESPPTQTAQSDVSRTSAMLFMADVCDLSEEELSPDEIPMYDTPAWDDGSCMSCPPEVCDEVNNSDDTCSLVIASVHSLAHNSSVDSHLSLDMAPQMEVTADPDVDSSECNEHQEGDPETVADTTGIGVHGSVVELIEDQVQVESSLDTTAQNGTNASIVEKQSYICEKGEHLDNSGKESQRSVNEKLTTDTTTCCDNQENEEVELGLNVSWESETDNSSSTEIMSELERPSLVKHIIPPVKLVLTRVEKECSFRDDIWKELLLGKRCVVHCKRGRWSISSAMKKSHLVPSNATEEDLQHCGSVADLCKSGKSSVSSVVKKSAQTLDASEEDSQYSGSVANICKGGKSSVSLANKSDQTLDASKEDSQHSGSVANICKGGKTSVSSLANKSDQTLDASKEDSQHSGSVGNLCKGGKSSVSSLANKSDQTLDASGEDSQHSGSVANNCKGGKSSVSSLAKKSDQSLDASKEDSQHSGSVANLCKSGKLSVSSLAKKSDQTLDASGEHLQHSGSGANLCKGGKSSVSSLAKKSDQTLDASKEDSQHSGSVANLCKSGKSSVSSLAKKSDLILDAKEEDLQHSGSVVNQLVSSKEDYEENCSNKLNNNVNDTVGVGEKKFLKRRISSTSDSASVPKKQVQEFNFADKLFGVKNIKFVGKIKRKTYKRANSPAALNKHTCAATFHENSDLFGEEAFVPDYYEEDMQPSTDDGHGLTMKGDCDQVDLSLSLPDKHLSEGIDSGIAVDDGILNEKNLSKDGETFDDFQVLGVNNVSNEENLEKVNLNIESGEGQDMFDDEEESKDHSYGDGESNDQVNISDVSNIISVNTESVTETTGKLEITSLDLPGEFIESDSEDKLSEDAGPVLKNDAHVWSDLDMDSFTASTPSVASLRDDGSVCDTLSLHDEQDASSEPELESGAQRKRRWREPSNTSGLASKQPRVLVRRNVPHAPPREGQDSLSSTILRNTNIDFDVDEELSICAPSEATFLDDFSESGTTRPDHVLQRLGGLESAGSWLSSGISAKRPKLHVDVLPKIKVPYLKATFKTVNTKSREDKSADSSVSSLNRRPDSPRRLAVAEDLLDASAIPGTSMNFVEPAPFSTPLHSAGRAASATVTRASLAEDGQHMELSPLHPSPQSLQADSEASPSSSGSPWRPRGEIDVQINNLCRLCAWEDLAVLVVEKKLPRSTYVPPMASALFTSAGAAQPYEAFVTRLLEETLQNDQSNLSKRKEHLAILGLSLLKACHSRQRWDDGHQIIFTMCDNGLKFVQGKNSVEERCRAVILTVGFCLEKQDLDGAFQILNKSHWVMAPSGEQRRQQIALLWNMMPLVIQQLFNISDEGRAKHLSIGIKLIETLMNCNEDVNTVYGELMNGALVCHCIEKAMQLYKTVHLSDTNLQRPKENKIVLPPKLERDFILATYKESRQVPRLFPKAQFIASAALVSLYAGTLSSQSQLEQQIMGEKKSNISITLHRGLVRAEVHLLLVVSLNKLMNFYLDRYGEGLDLTNASVNVLVRVRPFKQKDAQYQGVFQLKTDRDILQLAKDVIRKELCPLNYAENDQVLYLDSQSVKHYWQKDYEKTKDETSHVSKKGKNSRSNEVHRSYGKKSHHGHRGNLYVGADPRKAHALKPGSLEVSQLFPHRKGACQEKFRFGVEHDRLQSGGRHFPGDYLPGPSSWDTGTRWQQQHEHGTSRDPCRLGISDRNESGAFDDHLRSSPQDWQDRSPAFKEPPPPTRFIPKPDKGRNCTAKSLADEFVMPPRQDKKNPKKEWNHNFRGFGSNRRGGKGYRGHRGSARWPAAVVGGFSGWVGGGERDKPWGNNTVTSGRGGRNPSGGGKRGLSQGRGGHHMMGHTQRGRNLPFHGKHLVPHGVERSSHLFGRGGRHQDSMSQKLANDNWHPGNSFRGGRGSGRWNHARGGGPHGSSNRPDALQGVRSWEREEESSQLKPLHRERIVNVIKDRLNYHKNQGSIDIDAVFSWEAEMQDQIVNGGKCMNNKQVMDYVDKQVDSGYPFKE